MSWVRTEMVLAPVRARGGRRARRQAQEHPHPRGPAPEPGRSTSARSRAGSSCRSRTTSRRAAMTGGSSRRRAPTEPQWRDAELAWRIGGHVKSNSIVLVKDGQAVGIGAGQQNRVESGEIAAKKADGPRGGRRGARAMRSTRSLTASRRRPRQVWPSSCSRAGRCATTRTSNVPTSSALRWSSPANDTSSIDRAKRRRRDDGRAARREGVPRADERRLRSAGRRARRPWDHAGAGDDPRRRRSEQRTRTSAASTRRARDVGHRRRTTVSSPPTSRGRISTPRSPRSTRTRPSTRSSCSCRCRPRSTRRRRCWRSIPRRTPTASTR